MSKFNRHHKGNPYYEVPQLREGVFVVVHYAGKVKYSTVVSKGFCKNILLHSYSSATFSFMYFGIIIRWWRRNHSEWGYYLLGNGKIMAIWSLPKCFFSTDCFTILPIRIPNLKVEIESIIKLLSVYLVSYQDFFVPLSTYSHHFLTFIQHIIP